MARTATQDPTTPSTTSVDTPTFDVLAMSDVLDGPPPYRDLRRRIRSMLASPRFAYRDGLDRDAYRDVVLRWCRDLARAGLGSLAYPEEHGGAGDVAASIVAFETIAYHDLSLLVKFGVQFGLFGGAIGLLGTASHHATYLRRVGTLDLPGCFAMTETGHGSNVRDVRTVARYDPVAGGFEIHTPDDDARKDLIGNAARHGRVAVVFAQLEVGGEAQGVHAFVVPIRDGRGRPRRGVRIEDCGEKIGLNGVDNGRLWFDHVRVPREAMLNRFGDVTPGGAYESPIAHPAKRFFAMLGTLIAGRICVASGSVSAAKSALTIAVRYGLRRRQFGPPGQEETILLDYPAHQRRLLPALATTYALDFAVEDLVAEYARSHTAKRYGDRERQRLEALAAGIKALATWHCVETVQACREACGGRGYLAVNRLGRLRADTDVFTTFEGDNTVLLQLVAKSLLTNYRQEFEDLDALGLARSVARRVVGTIAEAVPAGLVAGMIGVFPGRAADGGELRTRPWQQAAFRFREEHLLDSLARRMQRAMQEGSDSYQAFLLCQDHMVAMARAHVERVVLESFVAGIDRCEDGGVRDALDRLCDLFALSRIERDRGWFLEHGHVSATTAKLVSAAVGKLCGEIRPIAGALVDAFGIPDELLAAPIATGPARSSLAAGP